LLFIFAPANRSLLQTRRMRDIPPGPTSGQKEDPNMGDLLKGISSFRGAVFPNHSALYRKLAREGQQPQALMISCADSRVMPETITQSGPGELFVCRNAGNIVPPFSILNGGVSSAIEYAILALGVSDIVVCGHSDCGAMKGLCHPEILQPMPNVPAWLRHSHAAYSIVCQAYPDDLSESDRVRAVAMENVIVELDHLKTHPSVAAKLATSEITLHGAGFSISRPAKSRSMTGRRIAHHRRHRPFFGEHTGGRAHAGLRHPARSVDIGSGRACAGPVDLGPSVGSRRGFARHGMAVDQPAACPPSFRASWTSPGRHLGRHSRNGRPAGPSGRGCARSGAVDH
jgi:carbonic anhydrase